ncbi:hypothetical protein V2K98_08135 [Pseudomonas alliivorans]|nr:hypothetical protein [Pseudomonas alliivorans]
MQDWRGKLVCDDFGGYKASFELGVTEIGCIAHVSLTVAPTRGVENRTARRRGGGGGTTNVWLPPLASENEWARRVGQRGEELVYHIEFQKVRDMWATRILSCMSYGHRKTSRSPTMTSAPLTPTGSLGGLNWNQRQAWVAGLNGLAESLKRHYVKGPLRVVARLSCCR